MSVMNIPSLNLLISLERSFDFTSQEVKDPLSTQCDTHNFDENSYAAWAPMSGILEFYQQNIEIKKKE